MIFLFALATKKLLQILCLKSTNVPIMTAANIYYLLADGYVIYLTCQNSCIHSMYTYCLLCDRQHARHLGNTSVIKQSNPCLQGASILVKAGKESKQHK